jgi:hypothetical protein
VTCVVGMPPCGARALGAPKYRSGPDVAWYAPARPSAPVYHATWTRPAGSTASAGPAWGQASITQPSAWTRTGAENVAPPSTDRATTMSRA